MASSRSAGFTLLELMIALVIAGIIAAVGYPSYVNYVRKGQRADAQQYMMAVAQANQQYFTDNRAFTDTLASLVPTPANVSSRYTVTVTIDAGPPATFTVTAAPKGSQTADSCGTLTLTSAGVRGSSSGSNCW